MLNYSLRYGSSDKERVQTLSFYAHSTAGALDLAKQSAGGDWAELFQDGQLLCRLRLVDDAGVWAVFPVANDSLD